MKIAILYGPGDLRIEEQPLPEQLGPTEIRVKTRISALKIGTDRGNYEGAEQVPGAPDFPRWVGDSNLGVVTQIGANVNEFSVGDRVIGNLPHQSEYVADQSAPIVRVPEGVDDDDAVYGWLYNLSAFCYRKALFQPGEFVAVVGLGVLGLGAVGVGANIGARVIGIGNSEIRLDMARKMGAEVAFLYNDPNLHDKLNEFTGGHGVDLVIQTANPWPALRSSCEIVRNNGRVSIVALPGRGEPPLEFNPLDMKWFYNKGISLIAVSGLGGNVFAAEDDLTRRKQDCQFVLSLMRDARLEPKRLITHRFPYQEMQQAYDMALRREKDMLGVIFEW